MGQVEPFAGQPIWQLRDYLAILRARKWSLIGVTLLVAGTALLLSARQVPEYESTSRVLVQSVDVSASGSGPPLQPNVETERQLVASNSVASMVKERLGLDESTRDLLEHLSVDAVANTEILVIRYRDTDPAEARRRDQAFATAYLDHRRTQFVQNVESLQGPLEIHLQTLTDQLTLVNHNLATERNPSVRESLQAEATSLISEIALIRDRLGQLVPPERLQVGQIEDPADLPIDPVNRDFVKNGGAGLFIGLVLGITVALLRERLDDRLRDDVSFEGALRAPVLTSIPKLAKAHRGTAQLVGSDPTDIPAADAFRSLSASVMHALSKDHGNALLVTSPNAGEGKTTVSANLATAVARTGKRVILVSGDIHRPQLHRFFKSKGGGDLIDLLERRATFWEALHETQIENLALLPSGTATGEQVELLRADSIARLLTDLRKRADLVLVDAPPLLEVADAIALVLVADAVLLVADRAGTTSGAVVKARRQLDLVNASLLGGVLNNFQPERAQRYFYYYAADRNRPRRGLESLPANDRPRAEA